VVLPPITSIKKKLSEVRDSKQMSPRKRELWAVTIRKECLSWGVGFARPEEIDVIGIVPATRLAVWRALEKLPDAPDHLITDYLMLPDIDIPQTSLIKGDRRSLSVAAASVLAKTSRDAFMRDLDKEHPGYGFGQHKGYGTRGHRKAIQKLGFTPIHRKSFHFRKP